MSKHAASRPARLRGGNRSGKARALLSLGLLLGIAAPGTLAYWTDSATMTGGDFTSGTLNLQLSGQEGTTESPWANVNFALGAMLPGESKAIGITLDNVGDAGFTITATAKSVAGSGDDLSPALRYSISVGGTVAGGARTGTCTGGTLLGPYTLGSAFQPVITSADNVAGILTVTPTQKTPVCIVVVLPADADNSAQGDSAKATFVFDAEQVPVTP